MKKEELIVILKEYNKDLKVIARNLYKTTGNIRVLEKREIQESLSENEVGMLVKMGKFTVPIKFHLEDNLNSDEVWSVIERCIKILVERAAIEGFVK